MEVAGVEMEDDLIFADISKQISLLIMEEDEDPAARSPSVSLQAYSRVAYPPPPHQSPKFLEQNWRRESKGTGVFIPQSSHTRRKVRQGRSNSKSNRKPHKAREVSQISHNSSFNSKGFEE